MQRQKPAWSLGEAAKHISLWAQLPWLLWERQLLARNLMGAKEMLFSAICLFLLQCLCHQQVAAFSVLQAARAEAGSSSSSVHSPWHRQC